MLYFYFPCQAQIDSMYCYPESRECSVLCRNIFFWSIQSASSVLLLLLSIKTTLCCLNFFLEAQSLYDSHERLVCTTVKVWENHFGSLSFWSSQFSVSWKRTQLYALTAMFQDSISKTSAIWGLIHSFEKDNEHWAKREKCNNQHFSILTKALKHMLTLFRQWLVKVHASALL